MRNVALVTGASSGIGLELARLHAEAGGDVVAVALDAERLATLKFGLESGYGVTVRTITLDLTAPDGPQQLYDALAADGVVIDVLMNNAGFGGRGLFHERPWSRDLAMIQLNIVALSALTRLFLPDFVARGRGRILNTSSAVSLAPGGPLQAVYYATKAYVTAFSNALAVELEGTGVTVTTLMPGATRSNFAATAEMADAPASARSASTRSVAERGYRAMMRGDLEVVAGLPLRYRLLLGTLRPFLPKRLVLRAVRRAQIPPKS